MESEKEWDLQKSVAPRSRTEALVSMNGSGGDVDAGLVLIPSSPSAFGRDLR
jgi:hypothetical protein